MTHTASVHQHGTDPKGQPLPGKPISAARRAGTPALHDVSNPVRAIPNNLYLCQGTQQPFRTGPPPPPTGERPGRATSRSWRAGWCGLLHLQHSP